MAAAPLCEDAPLFRQGHGAAMMGRLMVLGLDDALGKQLQGDLRIAFPQASIDTGALPTDVEGTTRLAAYDAILLGYDHTRAEGDGAGPESVLAPFRGSGALVLLISRGGNELTAVDAVRAGAADFIPARLVSPRLLAERVNAAL